MAKYRAGPEKTIQSDIIKYLLANGIYVWNAKAIPIAKRKYSVKLGVPDILGWLPQDGRILGIEVKTKTGKVSPEQRAFLDQIVKDSGVAGVARSIEDVIQILGGAIGVKQSLHNK